MLTARVADLGAISSGGWMVLDRSSGRLVPYTPAATTSTKPWTTVSASQYAQVKAAAAKAVTLSPQQRAAAEWEARRQRAAAATARERARVAAARQVAEQKRAVARAESQRKAAEAKAKAAAIRERTRREQAAAYADYERRAAEKRAQAQAAGRRKEQEIAAAIAESERRAAEDRAQYYASKEIEAPPKRAAWAPALQTRQEIPRLIAPAVRPPSPPPTSIRPLPPLLPSAPPSPQEAAWITDRPPPFAQKTWMELPPLVF